jgi:phosphatidylinositol alpha-1,6-mannosyltransferase
MQRVATELHAVLRARDDVEVRTVALRSSSKWFQLKSIPFLTSLTMRLGRETEAFGADAILFTGMLTALPLLVAGPRLKRKGVRLAAIAHGLDVTDPNRAYQAAVRRLRDSIDIVMPVSHATGEELIARGWPRQKVKVVPNGIDLDRFEGIATVRPEARDVQIAGATPPPQDALLLVAVGRQVRRKGFSWFIENVMPRLPEDVFFWLAGDGPERENIAAAIQRGGLQHRVRCLGRISEAELTELYRCGHLFVMPNISVPGDMEGFGVVMLEAGACGLPTLAADLEGIRDVIREGVNGWLAAPGDADAFCERIHALVNDRAQLRTVGGQASAYVSSAFSWEQSAERYLELLRAPPPSGRL